MKFKSVQKVLASFGLFASLVLLTGCPYSSVVPIDEGTVEVSSALAGEWISSSDIESENPTYYILSFEDKFHVTAKEMQYSSDDSSYSEKIYHLTFSNVDGDTFMNVIEDEGTAYSLYKFNFDINADEVYTSEVTDYIEETFSTSEELKDFIAKNKSNSYFFTDQDETFVRKPLTY